CLCLLHTGKGENFVQLVRKRLDGTPKIAVVRRQILVTQLESGTGKHPAELYLDSQDTGMRAMIDNDQVWAGDISLPCAPLFLGYDGESRSAGFYELH